MPSGGDPDLTKLEARLSSPEEAQRADAIDGLRQSGDPRAVELLRGALGDSSPYVRAIAVQAIGDLGVQEAYPDLEHLLGDEEVRSGVLVALGRLGNPKALRPLLAGLRDSEPLDVQSAAAQGLGLLRDVTALQTLKEVAEDPNRDAGVRYMARVAAGRIDPSEREPRTILIWTAGMAMIVGGIAVAALLHAAGVLLFAAGVGLLVTYWWRELRGSPTAHRWGTSGDSGIWGGWGGGHGGGGGNGGGG
jgi:HEAT repeat protein